MGYHFSKKVAYDFDRAIERMTEELKKEGFGIITEIDVKKTFRDKLNVDFPRYKILGACSPAFAYRAIQADDKAGTMLPCNIVIQEHENGQVEISAIDPVASLMAIRNDEIVNIATEVQQKLKNVIANL